MNNNIDAREIAARALEKVLAEGAYAAAALDDEMFRHTQLDVRDRGLATEILYGCLRTRGVLRSTIQSQVKKLKNDVFLESRLLVAAYQLLILTRVPPHAAVDVAVRSIRKGRGARVGGFANAVLRKISQLPKLEPQRAALDSAPPWLVSALGEAVGEDQVGACLWPDRANAGQVGLRCLDGKPQPEWLMKLPQGRWSPRARIATRASDPRRLEGWTEGAFTIQEEGAQIVGLALGAQPGERILDACAGRGQKTSLLAEQLGGEGALWATDLHAAKVATLERELARLGLMEARTSVVDWTKGVGDVPDDFDRVMVDAPCTGTGTLSHRPEIALRLTQPDPARMAVLSEAILRQAASRAKVGGRVVYAVCSLLPEEGERVAERVSDILEPLAFDAAELQPLLEPGQSRLRLTPGEHGTDGYFMASFRRR